MVYMYPPLRSVLEEVVKIIIMIIGQGMKQRMDIYLVLDCICTGNGNSKSNGMVQTVNGKPSKVR